MCFKKRYLLVMILLPGILNSCKKWDDHIAVTNPALNQNLMQAVSANAKLSKFKEYIAKVKLDTILTSSKTYTVWAPSDDALQSLDPTIVNDTAKLKNFILNHISNQSYFTKDASAGLRVPMLNGKYNNFSTAKFEDATITAADQLASNGVLHVIDKFVPVLQNIWDYINSTTGTYNQNAYIVSLNFSAFDPSIATIDSISSSTGLPVYHPGTGIVSRNKFNDRVYDLKREDKQYTYFVIANAGFALESDSLKPYYKATSTATTDSLDKWNVVKDLVFEGAYPAGTLPAQLVSKSGVTVPLSTLAIVDTKKLSNGIVYVMSKVDVPTASKFSQIVIEGERPSGFLSDKPSNTNYRVRMNPVTNKPYNDILVSGHGVSAYYAYYSLNEIPSVKYKVYALAVNDFQTAALTQNIVVKAVPAGSILVTLPHSVPLSTAAGAYNEILLGEFTPTGFGSLEIQLTASGTSPIVLDYLRLVPVP